MSCTCVSESGVRQAFVHNRDLSMILNESISSITHLVVVSKSDAVPDSLLKKISLDVF